MSHKLKILVTGVGGNLGAAFVDQFKDCYDLAGVDVSREAKYASKSVPFQSFDLAATDDCYKQFEWAKDVLGGLDGFVHCGAISAPGKDQNLTFEVNLKGTYYCLDACVQHQLSQVILATSGWVQGLPNADIKPRKFPIDENTRGIYRDVYHVSKQFNEENGKMLVTAGKLAKVISLRFGGIIDTNKEGLKGLSTDSFWTRVALEDAAMSIKCAIEEVKSGFDYFLIGSQMRYGAAGELETAETLKEKMLKNGYESLLSYLEGHYPGRQTYDLTKSKKLLNFSPKL